MTAHFMPKTNNLFSKNVFNNLNEFNILSIYNQALSNDNRHKLKDPTQFQEIIKERKCKLYKLF